MAKATRVHSTPPINMSAIQAQSSRRTFLAQAAGAATGGAVLGMAIPLPAPAATPQGLPDPIFAAIERHRAAGIVWDAAVDVRSVFPEGPEPMTDERWEQRRILDEAVDEARDVLDKAGVDLISTMPTTVRGIVSAIAYIQRQMRDDGTFMPFDVEFHYDVGYESDSAVVFGWLDAFLNTIAGAVSEFDPAPVVQL
jgi:hypothetical protein